MGKQDTVTAKYMRTNRVFADAFNYYMFDGEQVIQPDDLVELDTKEVEVPYGGEKGAKQPVQKTRDVIKSLAAMTDSKRRSVYLILGIENQSHIHYAMPVRNMLYDALQYTKQVEEAIESHKQTGDYVSTQSDEFLSGFMKEDRLMPVLTLVIYWGAKTWDGSISIHEMCRDWDERFMAFVPDYRMNLIVPAAIEDEDFDKFQSSLKEVLSFIKYSDDKEKLQEYVLSNDSFRHLGRDEVNVLNACVNTGITVNEEDNMEVDMCRAFQELKDDARAEGLAEGRELGIELGRAEGLELGRELGIELGRAEGRAEAEAYAEKKRLADLKEIVTNLMRNMQCTTEAAMNILGISEKDRKSLIPLM